MKFCPGATPSFPEPLYSFLSPLRKPKKPRLAVTAAGLLPSPQLLPPDRQEFLEEKLLHIEKRSEGMKIQVRLNVHNLFNFFLF